MAQATFVREKYEWSNNWWDNMDDTASPRVLLIGDSISVGYGPTVIEKLAGKFRVDRLSNSRAINDPFHLKETMNVVNDVRYSAIHFNNGLHGCHLSLEEYAAGLRYFVQMLRHESKGAALIWASSTPVTRGNDVNKLEPKVNGLVIKRNAAAAKIMKELNVPINDLYSLVVGKGEIRAADGYHYQEAGSKLMGDAVAKSLTATVSRSAKSGCSRRRE